MVSGSGVPAAWTSTRARPRRTDPFSMPGRASLDSVRDEDPGLPRLTSPQFSRSATHLFRHNAALQPGLAASRAASHRLASGPTVHHWGLGRVLDYVGIPGLGAT